MAWAAIYETATGRLVSVGSVVADPLPGGHTALPLADRPLDTQMWDATSKTFVSRPAKVLVDRLQDLIADTDFATAYNSLSAARKTQIRNGVIRFLASRRYRNTSEGVTLDA